MSTQVYAFKSALDLPSRNKLLDICSKILIADATASTVNIGASGKGVLGYIVPMRGWQTTVQRLTEKLLDILTTCMFSLHPNFCCFYLPAFDRYNSRCNTYDNT